MISAVRNEAKHIERVIAAVAAQTRPPDLWIVIDDASSDGTAEILERLEPAVGFLRVLRVDTDGPRAQRDRLAVAAEARAFNRALGTVDWRGYTHIGKLDGDVELPPIYLERILEEFAGDRRLGIAGGSLVERSGEQLRRVRIPEYHVHGAVKMYRRDCFERVGGIEQRLGWDTIDETYARMRGFATRSLPDLVALHHRHSATADGALRGRARHGTCAYILRYDPLWVAARSIKVATARPIGLSGLAFLYGYLSGPARRVERVEDDAFKRFVRRELRARLLGPLYRTKAGCTRLRRDSLRPGAARSGKRRAPRAGEAPPPD